MSADVERISTGLRQCHELWASILDISLALWLLQRQLNIAAFAPLAVILGELGDLHSISFANC